MTTTANLGDQYRLMQAAKLIQGFRETVEVDGEECEVPVFVPSKSEPGAFELNPLLRRQGKGEGGVR